jgi:hypothetical protein
MGLHIDMADAGLAQLVEHLICNQGVTSSNLVAGTIIMINPKIADISAHM